MNEERSAQANAAQNADAEQRPGGRIRRSFLLVEWLAASVLWMIMLLIGWMTLVSQQPTWLRLSPGEPQTSEPIEVVGVTVILVAALLLVSVVALRDTRR